MLALVPGLAMRAVAAWLAGNGDVVYITGRSGEFHKLFRAVGCSATGAIENEKLLSSGAQVDIVKGLRRVGSEPARSVSASRINIKSSAGIPAKTFLGR